MVRHVAALILFLLCSLATPAFADSITVIDFEEASVGGYNLVASQGFRFSNPNFSFQILADGTNHYLAPGPEIVVMSRLDGLPFNVMSMDFRRRFPAFPEALQIVPLLAFFRDGTQQSLIVPGVNSPTFQTFNIGLNDVAFLHFSLNGTFQVEVDNIVTNVPEYSTFGLLMAGMFFAVTMRSRLKA